MAVIHANLTAPASPPTTSPPAWATRTLAAAGLAQLGMA
ncbi:hypothetical protein SAMN04489732_129137 [Amycolatopsis saalfeldensis]|uniref:Uncharacterized protein n=1 Tax=Amycolatopsis saalfeldensis TaxID=394193 RepID=A0A1H8YNW3_9PSEU|nr:hypothetical protein SAMN04489732_129137 [Amycolatopsis saalfeldensis]